MTRRQQLISVSDAGIVETLITNTSLPTNSSSLGLTVDRYNNHLLAVVHRIPSPENPSPFNALASYDLQSDGRLYLSPLLSEEDFHLAVDNYVVVDYSDVVNYQNL